MSGRLVIIGCGARKLDRPAIAAELYVGPYFSGCLATALHLAGRGDVRILSARYGLLGLDDEIEPYDLTIGQPGAITVGELGAQAAAAGELGRPVLALCSARYAALIREVWQDVSTPLAGLGIGYQRAVLAELRRS